MTVRPWAAPDVEGDFDDDGDADGGAFYHYDNSQTALFVFPANGSAGFGPPAVKWDSGPGTWAFNQTAPV